MRYKGDWYGEEVIWEDYIYKKKDTDPSFWADEQMRVKPINDYTHNGGFILAYALDINLITPIEEIK